MMLFSSLFTGSSRSSARWIQSPRWTRSRSGQVLALRCTVKCRPPLPVVPAGLSASNALYSCLVVSCETPFCAPHTWKMVEKVESFFLS
jgi:hypothetical protein